MDLRPDHAWVGELLEMGFTRTAVDEAITNSCDSKESVIDWIVLSQSLHATARCTEDCSWRVRLLEMGFTAEMVNAAMDNECPTEEAAIIFCLAFGGASSSSATPDLVADPPFSAGEATAGEECIICFEPIPPHGRPELPCACRVPYCYACWDKALASAYSEQQVARCPTCRTAVRVMLDESSLLEGRGRLLFEAASEDSPTPPDPTRAMGAAAPLMRRALRRYGAEHPLLRPLAREPQLSAVAQALESVPTGQLKQIATGMDVSLQGCVERDDVIERIHRGGSSPMDRSTEAEAAAASDGSHRGSDANSHANSHASSHSRRAAVIVAALDAINGVAGPPCVCGGALVHTSGRERCRASITKLAPQQVQRGADFQDRLEQALHNVEWLIEHAPGITCDLCGERQTALMPVYTCNNGYDTMWHPTGCDVCVKCHVRFAVDGGAHSAASGHAATT